MKISDFDYELPPELIAQQPPAQRESARLLVYRREDGSRHHSGIRELAKWLRPGDLLVVNDTRVLPARLSARRASGGRVRVLLTEPIEGSGWRWRALLQPARKLTSGERLDLELPEPGRVDFECGETRGRARLVLGERERRSDGQWESWWPVSFEDPDGCPIEDPSVGLAWLERIGRMPLPPYIERAEEERASHEPLDRERYQTVFASVSGAVAAPTAGLHLTDELLGELERAGVERASVTLHVGAGTFQPVRVEHLEEHRMHSERYELGSETAQAIAACRARGGRVCAVGTTTTRVLETCADGQGGVRPGAGTTALFLKPGSRFSVVDALLTNFHLPRSTLLVLVSAFVGRDQALELYRAAVEERYRFFSYGDAMLLL